MRTLSIILMGFLMGCGSSAQVPSSSVQEFEEVALATPTLFSSATPSPTYTPVPTPQIDMHSIVLPEGTGRLYSQEDKEFYDSQFLYIGQDIEVAAIHHETADGDFVPWLVIQDHPNWPLFIWDGATSSWAQAMKYVEVRRSYSFPKSFVQEYAVGLQWLRGNKADEPEKLGLLDYTEYRDDARYGYYWISVIIQGRFYTDENGVVRLPVAASLDGNSESPMIEFTLAFPPIPENERQPVYHIGDLAITDNIGLGFHGPLDTWAFRGRTIAQRFLTGNQIVVMGLVPYDYDSLQRMRDDARINFQIALDHKDENLLLFDVLRSGVYPESPMEDLALWGMWYFYIDSK